ncbi:MAG: hypothetical protein V5A45_08785 [Haloarculaceae archaeon]|jgi:hypothetical protein
MFPKGRGTRIVVFVSCYLLLSVPPYLALNWGVVVDVLSRSFPPSPLAIGLIAVTALVILATLVRASEGVDRYAQFLLAPTDWLSILIGLAFILAGASWWAVPEIILEWFGRIDLNVLYFLVFLAHVPMLLFLSLMTAIGFAQQEAENR